MTSPCLSALTPGCQPQPASRTRRATRPAWARAAVQGGGLAMAVLLAACGGGSDSDSSAGGAASGSSTLSLSGTTPAANTTTLDLATATSKGNQTRAADSFSSTAYCELFWENVAGANGVKYAVQVYFRQSDRAVLHTSVVGANGWVVFHNNAGAPITGVVVDTAARTLSYNAKVLNGGSGEVATVNGSVGFPANSATPACGA